MKKVKIEVDDFIASEVFARDHGGILLVDPDVFAAYKHAFKKHADGIWRYDIEGARERIHKFTNFA